MKTCSQKKPCWCGTFVDLHPTSRIVSLPCALQFDCQYALDLDSICTLGTSTRFSNSWWSPSAASRPPWWLSSASSSASKHWPLPGQGHCVSNCGFHRPWKPQSKFEFSGSCTLEQRKIESNLSVPGVQGTRRTPPSRASKWAPTWYVSRLALPFKASLWIRSGFRLALKECWC